MNFPSNDVDNQTKIFNNFQIKNKQKKNQFNQFVTYTKH